MPCSPRDDRWPRRAWPARTHQAIPFLGCRRRRRGGHRRRDRVRRREHRHFRRRCALRLRLDDRRRRGVAGVGPCPRRPGREGRAAIVGPRLDRNAEIVDGRTPDEPLWRHGGSRQGVQARHRRGRHERDNRTGGSDPHRRRPHHDHAPGPGASRGGLVGCSHRPARRGCDCAARAAGTPARSAHRRGPAPE